MIPSTIAGAGRASHNHHYHHHHYSITAVQIDWMAVDAQATHPSYSCNECVMEHVVCRRCSPHEDGHVPTSLPMEK